MSKVHFGGSPLRVGCACSLGAFFMLYTKKEKKFSEASRKVPEFTHQLVVKHTHVAIQPDIQAAAPKRGMRRTAIAAISFHTARSK